MIVNSLLPNNAITWTNIDELTMKFVLFCVFVASHMRAHSLCV